MAASFTGIAFQLGWVVSPNVSGWFQVTFGETGFVPVFSTTSVLYVIAIIVTWTFFRNVEKSAEPDTASTTAGDA